MLDIAAGVLLAALIISIVSVGFLIVNHAMQADGEKGFGVGLLLVLAGVLAGAALIYMRWGH